MKRRESAVLIARFGVAAALIFAVVQIAPVLNRRLAGRGSAVKTTKKDPYLDWVDPSKGMRILMFYASPGVVVEGEAASLCYGVMNAKSVKIFPLDEELRPSFNRCLEIFPRHDTEYELTATDAAGATIRQSLTVKVIADPAKAPKIAYFRISDYMLDNYDKHQVWKLCFFSWNAEEVRIEPQVFPPWKLLQGCFYVEPKQPTTYTLTVHGDRGRSISRKLTIDPAKPRG
jgi:hypothetical protein